MTKLKHVIFFLTLVLVASCVKDSNPDDNTNGTDNTGDRYIIMNEGAFSGNNASLSEYNPETGEVKHNMFKTKNNFPLGDVAQSMNIINDSLLWIVVNNSGKIEIVNANTYESVSTIEGLTSPRHLLNFNDSKAYVSDIVSPSLSVIDMNSLTVTGNIALPATVESLVKYGENHIIAAAWVGNNKLYKIDVNTEKVVDSLEIAYEPNSMAYDAKGNLWVLCGGGYFGAPYRESPRLIQVIPENMEIKATYPFPSENHYPSDLTYNSKNNALYFVVGTVATDSDLGVYQMSLGSDGISAQPFLAQGEKMFYTLNVDDEGDLWVTDPGDFSSPGTIYQVNSDGEILESIETGIVPTRIIKYHR